MRRPELLTAVAALVALLAAPVAAQDANEDRRFVQVQGAGEATATPDMATVTIGVTSEARTAARALDTNSADMAKVLDALGTAGVEARDIATTTVTLSPLYNRPTADGVRSIRGYGASNQVQIRVRALDTLGATLDAVTEAGATDIRGIAFGLQDPDTAMDEARRDAIADARKRATLYADAAGVTLGTVLSISETTLGFPVPMQRMAFAAEAAASAVPIAPGERSLSVNVNVVFALE
ncbi:MAG: SIMPL domain-containing protein [Pseudomonadota bacterium]